MQDDDGGRRRARGQSEAGEGLHCSDVTCSRLPPCHEMLNDSQTGTEFGWEKAEMHQKEISSSVDLEMNKTWPV